MILAGTLLLLTALAAGPCQSAAAATADALAAKFDEHQFIFIGSTHGDLKIEKFRTT